MANQGHIVVQPGSLDHFPSTYYCRKCDAQFKVLRDSVKTEVEHVSGCMEWYNDNGAPFCGCTNNGVITREIAICPTKGCEQRFIITVTKVPNCFCCFPVCVVM